MAPRKYSYIPKEHGVFPRSLSSSTDPSQTAYYNSYYNNAAQTRAYSAPEETFNTAAQRNNNNIYYSTAYTNSVRSAAERTTVPAQNSSYNIQDQLQTSYYSNAAEPRQEYGVSSSKPQIPADRSQMSVNNGQATAETYGRTVNQLSNQTTDTAKAGETPLESGASGNLSSSAVVGYSQPSTSPSEKASNFSAPSMGPYTNPNINPGEIPNLFYPYPGQAQAPRAAESPREDQKNISVNFIQPPGNISTQNITINAIPNSSEQQRVAGNSSSFATENITVNAIPERTFDSSYVAAFLQTVGNLTTNNSSVRNVTVNYLDSTSASGLTNTRPLSAGEQAQTGANSSAAASPSPYPTLEQPYPPSSVANPSPASAYPPYPAAAPYPAPAYAPYPSPAPSQSSANAYEPQVPNVPSANPDGQSKLFVIF